MSFARPFRFAWRPPTLPKHRRTLSGDSRYVVWGHSLCPGCHAAFHSKRALHKNERGSGSHGATLDPSSAGDGVFHGCLRAAWRSCSDYSFSPTCRWSRSHRLLRLGVSCKRARCTDRCNSGWQGRHAAMVANANAASVHSADLVVHSVARLEVS